MRVIRTHHRSFAVANASAVLLGFTGKSFADRERNLDPDPMHPAFPCYHWHHLRWDEDNVKKLGNGDFAQGLDALGKAGYRLMGVTTATEKGGLGYMIFTRCPWNKPSPRPQFEYLRVDEGAIAKRSNGVFDDGLAMLEAEGWELLAFYANS